MIRRASIAVACVLGAELILQLVAWRVWATEWIGPAGPAVPGVVLLVGAGESFEEGVLRREDAWPAEVARALTADGYEVRIVNGAAPGRDSSDVLRRLPVQLTLERPSRLVVCVGAEDFRRRAASPVDVAGLPGRNAPFPRRIRLLAPFIAAGPVAEPADGAPPFVGDWHFGDMSFAIEPDGTFRMGQAAARWTFDAEGVLEIEVPGSAPFVAGWVLEGDRLDLTGAFPGGHVSLFRGAPLAAPAERGARAIAAGGWDEAEWILRPAVVGAAQDLDAAATLVELWARAGRRQEAETMLARLEVEPDGPASRRRLARARIAVGRLDDGVQLVVDDLVACAADPLLVASLRGLPAGGTGDRVADAAMRACVVANGSARRPLAWIAADLYARGGRVDAARSALVLGLVAPPETVDPRDVPVFSRAVDEPAWAAERSQLQERDAERLEQRRAEIAAADARTAVVLEQNLTAIVELAQFYGAEVVLLDPADDPGAVAARWRAAERHGVPLVTCASDRDALVDALRAALSARLPRSGGR